MRRVDQLKARLRAGKDVDWATIGDPVANLRTGSLTWKKGLFIEIFEELLDANGRECGFYHSFTGGWFKDFCVARCDFNGLMVDYEREKDVGRLIHKGDCVGQLQFALRAGIFYRDNVELSLGGRKYADLVLPGFLGVEAMTVLVKLVSGESFAVRCAHCPDRPLSDGARFFADDPGGKRLHACVVAGCLFCSEIMG